jgi:hypothetical protein
MKNRITVTETRVAKTTHHLTLNRAEMINMLRAAGIAVPDHVEIMVRVPGGANWSNTDLEIDAYHKIEVKWENVETSEHTITPSIVEPRLT